MQTPDKDENRSISNSIRLNRFGVTPTSTLPDGYWQHTYDTQMDGHLGFSANDERMHIANLLPYPPLSIDELEEQSIFWENNSDPLNNEDGIDCKWPYPYNIPLEGWDYYIYEQYEMDYNKLVDDYGPDLERIQREFREYDRIQKKKYRRNKQITPDDQANLDRLRPSYLKGKKLRYAQQKCKNEQVLMKEREAAWQEEMLPKDENHALCQPVECGGYTLTHQCLFCRSLYASEYRLNEHHMLRCPQQLKAPMSFLEAFFDEIQDYRIRMLDHTDDYKTKLLPTNEWGTLVKPVYREGYPISYYQCLKCKELIQDDPVNIPTNVIKHYKEHIKADEEKPWNIFRLHLREWNRLKKELVKLYTKRFYSKREDLEKKSGYLAACLLDII